MRNSDFIKAASHKVFEKLLQMPSEDFHKLLESSELGYLGSFLYETNSVELVIDKQLTSYITIMPQTDKVINFVNRPYTMGRVTENSFLDNVSDNYNELYEDSLCRKAA